MLKQLLVICLLTQLNLVSLEQNENENNTRATRQLNFGECCPCPGQDAFQDQSPLNSRIDTVSAGDDDCPCRPPSDSEGAPSILSPAFRAVQPFMRQGPRKEAPKPLLNPEVGLASSVLETLREVTDQEYQEALVRDAERSALQFLEPDLQETGPKNVLNIILSPKERSNDDPISEATEIQSSSCILPPTSINNNFQQSRLQPPTNLLKHILRPPIFSGNGILNRNRYDMDSSASNIKEQATPLKHNILETMKSRLNLLNFKPFPNNDNRDFLTSPNILPKHYLKNNIRERLLSRKPLYDIQQTSPSNLNEIMEKNFASNDDLDIKPAEMSSLQQDPTYISNNHNSKKSKVVTEDILQSTCDKLVNESNERNLNNYDVIPSSSKIIEDIKEPSDIIQENDENTVLEHTNDNSNNNILEYVTEKSGTDNFVSEVSEVITEEPEVDLQMNDSKLDTIPVDTTEDKENMTEMNDMKSESSINRNVEITSEDSSPMPCISSTEVKSEKNTYSTVSADQELLSSISGKNDTKSKISTFPNLKEDIFRTLQNFKQANEKIQEKLRSNVQDALKQVIVDKTSHSPQEIYIEPQSEKHSILDEPRINTKSVMNTSDENSMSTKDLQKMSDSLLERSSLNNDSETLMTSDSSAEYANKIKNELEVLKNSDTDDMITSPTSLSENNGNIKEEKPNSNMKTVQMDVINDKIENRCKNDIMPKNSGSNIIDNEDNEMTAQPSNSVHKSISLQNVKPSKLGLKNNDFIAQPDNSARPIEGIKDFFNSFRAFGRERSSNEESELSLFENHPMFGYNNHKDIDSSKSFNTDVIPKLSSNSNLGSYKAKVASPKSLDINSLRSAVPFSDDESDASRSASQRMVQTVNAIKTNRNNFENGLGPLFKPLQTPKTLQDTFSSLTPRLGDKLGSPANNVLSTIKDSFNINREEPFTMNTNNLLRKPLIDSDHLFRTVARTHEDFNDKIQALHSDFNRRLSSLSLGSSPGGSNFLRTPLRLKNSKDNTILPSVVNKKAATIPAKPSLTSRNNSPLLKSIEPNKKNIAHSTPRSSKVEIFRSNLQEKLGILPHVTDLGHKKLTTTFNSPKNRQNIKKIPKTNLKLKPLKENKVTISFATTSIRPDTLKGSLTKLPKLSKSLEEKKMSTLKSKFNDPKVSASEISNLRTALPETDDWSISKEVTSLEKSEMTPNGYQKSENKHLGKTSEVNKRKNLLLSKLQSGLSPRIRNGNMKNNKLSSGNSDVDATHSASNNFDTNAFATSLGDESLKDKQNNQSFKCKMVCIQDILDTANKR